MPFSASDFKEVCHRRAMTPAIVSMDVEPLAATLITEHNASFPKSDSPECYISVVIGGGGRTSEAISDAKYFGLSYLSQSQVKIAQDVYSVNPDAIEWESIHNVPYVKGTNAVICSMHHCIPLGPNQLIVGHVMRAIIAETKERPLVNFDKHYTKINGSKIPLIHSTTSNIKNERLD